MKKKYRIREFSILWFVKYFIYICSFFAVFFGILWIVY